MKEKITKTFFYTCLTITVGVLIFFIVYNAQWLVGDDAIIIRHTGWGRFFNPTDTVIPSGGRFFPLAYFAYNILFVFGLTSVNAHFALHCIFFLIFAVCSILLMFKSIDIKQNIWKYIIVFAFVSICIQRTYISFLDGFSTIWMDYTLLIVWMLCTYYVHEKQSKAALLIGLIAVAYLTYCLEANFVLPLCYGIIGIVFSWKSASKLEKTYLLSLIGIAVIFLIVYFFTCYIHIEQAYDGSHGSEVTLLENAINMFVAQKILWIGVIVFLWRMFCVLIKKEHYEFWDTMIIAGFGFCCGCAILKLNWVMYYTMASLFMLPSIAHYSCRYLNEKVVAIIFISFAFFMCRKLPKQIQINQDSRLNTTTMMATIENLYKQGQTLYWFEPTDEREWCFDLELRAWLRESLQTQVGWQVREEGFKFSVINDIQCLNSPSGIYIVPKLNDKLFPDINDKIASAGNCIIVDKNSDFQVYLIE